MNQRQQNLPRRYCAEDQSAYRRGEYFWKELSVNNASAAIWQGVANRAVQGGATNTVAGNVFLAKTPEVFGYDADGNLTNDGRWALTWDAENRLTQVESLSSAPTASKRKLVWDYDRRGRRGRQSDYIWNQSTLNYDLSTDTKLLYDGWHCLAELNTTNNALVRSYLWGLDLSGTMEGAGGVGGLLAINSAANGVHFFAYDGNGNVTALVKGTDGTTSGNYEFDPFGQTVRATGDMAKENQYRFSTKRSDEATDFIHYEFRSYNPNFGRWISRDPLEEERSINLYGFVHNRPVALVDLLGLLTWDNTPDTSAQTTTMSGWPICTSNTAPLPAYAAAATIPQLSVAAKCRRSCGHGPFGLFRWGIENFEIDFHSAVFIRPGLTATELELVNIFEDDHRNDFYRWAVNVGKPLATEKELQLAGTYWITQSACENNAKSQMKDVLCPSLRQANNDSAVFWDHSGRHYLPPYLPP